MKKTMPPTGVAIIAFLTGIPAIYLLLQAFITLQSSAYRAAIYLGIAVVSALAVWGLLNLAGWGRYLTLVLSVNLLLYYTTVVWAGMMDGELLMVLEGLAHLAVNGWIVFYLIQPKTAAAFRRPA